MNVVKKVANKIENSRIIKNPKFLVIGLIIVIVIISLIYFIFLKYSPIMNFKYEGYAISGKEITENLLGSSDSNNSEAGASASKNLELAKIEEQGTIFKKLNEYFVGNKEKTEINLNYPIYINNNSTIYNLAEDTTFISKEFEQIAGYPNLSISEGKIYDGNNLERTDGKEYIFVKTPDNIFINLYEIKITTTANEYTIPVNSIIAFTENAIRYYTVNNNVLVFNEITDIDNNSNVEIVENSYTYEELLTRLGIIENKNTTGNEQEEQNNIIQENTTNTENNETEDKENSTENTEQETTEGTNQGGQVYIKPEVSSTDFTAEVYTAQSTLSIKDPAGRIIEAPTFEVYAEGKLYLRRIYTNSGRITINGLKPNTEYEIKGKYIYLNENDQKVENTFYEGKFATKGYEALSAITISKENGEIYNNKIQLVKVKITSDLNAEVIKGINKIEIVADGIKTTVKNDQANMLLQGKEVTLETSEGLKSNKKIEYEIKIYDLLGEELKVENNKGETRTSKQEPAVRVTVKEQDIVSVTLDLKLTNKDNAEMENYKYIITRPNGEKVKEEKLSENEKELKIDDLDSNQYYEIKIYADYDIEDGKGMQREQEIGKLVFATQPLSTLGSIEMQVEGKDISTTKATISYQIDEERTDKRLIQILEEIKIEIVEKETQEVAKEKEIRGEELEELRQGAEKEENYEGLKSNTTYEIRITSKVKQGSKEEEIQVTYNYKEFTTLRSAAKVEIQNQFVTGEMIDFDVRIEDRDNAVLNNKVRMELRDEGGNLIDLTEVETNKEYIRKTYERLDENRTYRLKFIADQYNEGNTDATYQANYLIKELEIVTEPGISGSLGLTELARKATGKNLVDMSSETKWYVYPNFNTSNYYGKEYNEETKILKLGGNSNHRRAVYDLREYAGQEVTMSFKAKAISGTQNAYIQNSKTDTNISKIDGLTTEWQDFQYTLTLDSTGYLGFYIVAGNGIEVKELQVELGNQKTSYEEFKYILQSNYSINLEDRRDEITTNDYYIKIYEDNNLVKTDRYEEIPEDNMITNAIKTYETQAGKQYKVELVIKIRDREYVLSEVEYNTQDTEEIKGIYNKEDFLEIQPRGHYIVLGDIDLSGGTGTQYRFGNGNMYFEGTIDFNGHILTRDSKMTEPIINYLGEKGKLENVVFNIKLNNEIEIKGFNGLIYRNYGTIENIQINLIESTRVPNEQIYLLGYENYGIINKFIIDYKVPMYGGRWLIGLISYNRKNGIISNGYVKGENIKAIFKNTQQGVRAVANITVHCSSNAIVRNIYTLNGIDTEGSEGGNGYIGHIGSEFYGSSKLENVYSVGLGDTYTNNGPNIYSWASSQKIQNSYYFNDQIFSSSYNRKSTPLALWDTTFQNQILNTDSAFNVDELVNQGYYPQIDMPECMPAQEYIELPEVEDKDLPDILSTEVLEQGTMKVKVKFRVNNPSAETITNIEVKNLNCDILSQEYKDGVSEVIAELNNPITCVSRYSVLGITTKGAYNQAYTREFEEDERKINVELYREIHSIEDWENIRKSLGENYILMADLDMKNQGANICIGIYRGILDGNNHVIKNINLPNNNAALFTGIYGTIKNLFVENLNIINNEKTTLGLIANIYTGGNVTNVHITNVNIENNKSIGNMCVGGLAGYANAGYIINSSVRDIKININNKNYSTNVGGLIGWGTNTTYIYNTFASNIDIDVNSVENVSIGGIVGSNSNVVENSYATGKIKSNNGNIGGITGTNVTTVSNCYSKVDIISGKDNIGGISRSNSNAGYYVGNLTLGDIYSSQYTQNMRRMVGNLELTGNNYAYSNQRINGYVSEENLGAADLLTYEQLTDKNTYLNKLSWENIYDISEVSEGILPKLKYKDSDELLPNQEDIFIEDDFILDIENVESSKDDINNVSVRIDINNPQEVEITGIEIEGMKHTINSIVTRNGGTYINLTATPIYCYDTYRISKIKYKIDGLEYEKEVAARIEQQFYKEIYSFEDWQTIDADGEKYENYKLMSDIDFSGRKDINTNVTMARLESAEGTKTLKNINLELINNEEVGLIKDITINLENINFEGISINANNKANKIGIISNSSAEMNNISFKDITINTQSDYIGCIATIKNANGNNIALSNITVSGNNYIGGLNGDYSDGNYTLSNVNASNITINATGNYVGGILGSANHDEIVQESSIEDSKITGNNYVGGMFGEFISNSTGNLISQNNIVKGNSGVGGLVGKTSNVDYIKSYNNEIYGSSSVGGVAGEAQGTMFYIESIGNKVIVDDVNGKLVGGVAGRGTYNISYVTVKDCIIKNLGDYTGGVIGQGGTNLLCSYNIVRNTIIEGNNNTGGFVGDGKTVQISSSYVEADIKGNTNVGGLIGYLDNTDMNSISNISKIQRNYVANTNIEGNDNVGGFIGNIAENLYAPDSFYYGNYIEADVTSSDKLTTSLGIGGRSNQNQYLKDTYYYKYSTINGENPNEQNEIFIPESAYLVEADLKDQETYTSKLKWSTSIWNFTVLDNNKYPILKNNNLPNQEGIDIPIDTEHMVGNIETSEVTQNETDKEQIEQTFEYANKEIQTYSTYSVIMSSDGSKVTRDAKLYVKDNNLYAVPTILITDNNDAEITPVPDNLILDNYNGKEYETVLGSDGKLYDLKEPITYPENFVNADIESIGNNLNSDTHEIEVTYKNGDKVKFNYQTGEVIASSKSVKSDGLGLFDYIKDKISEIGNSSSNVTDEISNKYEESKELQSKLEKTSVEEAIEKQSDNGSNTTNFAEGITAIGNNEANNSYKENKYISMYNQETGEYEIYNEEELLDTSKEEVVSENEKIEANNLNEYYASEGETKNMKLGIVWIVVSIIGVGIILFVLKRNLKRKA